MEYKVREIEFGDLFLLTKLLKKVDLKQMVKEIGFEEIGEKDEEGKNKMTKEKGVEAVIYLLYNCDEAEQEVLNLIGAWTGVKAADAKHLKLSELTTIVSEFIEINKFEDVMSFFGKAAQASITSKK